MPALRVLTADDPGGLAVLAANGTRTWEELEREAVRLANALRAAGVGPGETWAILAHNRVEWPATLLANSLAGTRLVCLNWHLAAGEVEYLLDNSGARLLLVDLEDEELGRAAAAGRDVDVRILGEEVDAWVQSAGDDVDLDVPAGQVMLYTGGTTGRSKPVARSDAAATTASWLRTTGRWGAAVGMPSPTTVLMTTPAYHALGYATIGSCLGLGNALILEPRFDAERFCALVEQHRVGAAPLVPTQLVRLAKLPREVRDRYDLSSLRWIMHTAAPCPAWAKREIIDWLGPIVVEMYGSSEGTGPIVATSHDWLARPGTVGRPVNGLELSIVDDDGNDLPAGEIGTIYVRRPDGLPEYIGDTEKTAASRLPDGRFTAGDIGWLDEDGCLYLADRRVDLIISGGVNIYPAEVEAVLSEHPDVHDVAVFGVPHPEWGQTVKAAVELEPGVELDADGLNRWCRERLAGFKCPTSYDVHDSLPRESSGKLKKRFLRDAYWHDAGATP